MDSFTDAHSTDNMTYDVTQTTIYIAPEDGNYIIIQQTDILFYWVNLDQLDCTTHFLCNENALETHKVGQADLVGIILQAQTGQ
jgi:hypothetical protein